MTCQLEICRAELVKAKREEVISLACQTKVDALEKELFDKEDELFHLSSELSQLRQRLDASTSTFALIWTISIIRLIHARISKENESPPRQNFILVWLFHGFVELPVVTDGSVGDSERDRRRLQIEPDRSSSQGSVIGTRGQGIK